MQYNLGTGKCSLTWYKVCQFISSARNITHLLVSDSELMQCGVERLLISVAWLLPFQQSTNSHLVIGQQQPLVLRLL